MASTAHRHTRRPSVRPAPRRAGLWGVRAVGLYFGGSAVLNAVYTVRIAHRLIGWFRDSAWVPPYRPVLAALEPVAPAVVLATAAFESVVGYHLVRNRRTSGALRWAQAWVLGLCPALPWPYWVPNAASAVVFEVVRRRAAAPVRAQAGVVSSASPPIGSREASGA
ncbi:hypothetical protein [Kocuria turfanensis]|uniref:hypothetical protein n=1 Tax=Kocuria turfanensis TaxID=388357 RepID=UPI004035ACB0